MEQQVEVTKTEEKPEPKRSATQERLLELLRENTGSHFLDSGGGYGRHWSRNQNREITKEEPSKCEFEIREYNDEPHLEIDIAHRVYHWLDERVDWSPDYDKAMKTCARFIRMANWRDGKRNRELEKVQDGDRHDYVWVERNGELPNQFELAQEFPRFFAAWSVRHSDDRLTECITCDGNGYDPSGELDDEGDGAACVDCGGHGTLLSYHLSYDQRKGFSFDGPEDYLVGGIYREGEPLVINTYNEQNLLDQTLQFVYFEMAHVSYIVLQVHGGCDVRGGYTDPVLFSCDGNLGELAILDYAKASLYCTEENKFDLDKQVELFPGNHDKADADDHHSWYTDDGHSFYASNNEHDLKKYPILAIEDASKWVKGKLCVVNETKKGLCPHCGGVLHAGSY